MIYLNNASQTPIKQEVKDTIMRVLENNWYNPSDIFQAGMDSRKLMDNAREIIAESINANPDEIIFCSSGSEANSMAISGTLRKHEYLATSNVEHNSILNNTCPKCLIKVDNQGFVHPDKLDEVLLLNYATNAVVSIMAANNEIGTINDIKELSKVAHKYGAIFHSDLTQYYPHYKVDVKELELDMATISFHKLGCCPGIAVLYKKREITMHPIIFGEQEGGLRGGTECLPLICGAAKAVQLMDYSSTYKVQNMRDKLFSDIVEVFGDRVHLNGASLNDKRLCNNLNIRFDNINNQQLIALLDLYGVCCSAGSSCNAHNPKPSKVLKAIGLTDKECMESIRISIDENTTDEDLKRLIKVLIDSINLLNNI